MADEPDDDEVIDVANFRRDDIPMDVAEKMVEMLQDQFPGKKIVFGGGSEDSLAANLNRIFVRHARRCCKRGVCLHCQGEHPRPWPPKEYILDDGWSLIDTHTGTPAFLCPVCGVVSDAKAVEAENGDTIVSTNLEDILDEEGIAELKKFNEKYDEDQNRKASDQ